LRSSFASNALAAGVTVFELARVMGTSVRMIERHYGALLDGAHSVIASRLDSFETELEKAAGEGKPGERLLAWASVPLLPLSGPADSCC
jgi:hypothetical protein